MPPRAVRVVPHCAIVLIATGCLRTREPEPAADVDQAAQQAEVWRAAADDLWPQRDDIDALGRVLARYEQAWQADPTDRAVALKLTHGWTLRGDASAEDEAAFDKARTWGATCLDLNRKYRRLRKRPGESRLTALRALSKVDAPCLYWTALALDGWSRVGGRARVLRDEAEVLAMMSRVELLSPTVDYRGTDRFLGARLATLPRFAGQDFAAARARLQRATDRYPDHLANSVAMAESWAVSVGNRQVFEATLQEVLTADPGAGEDAADNRLAQARARSLLEQAEFLFGPSPLLGEGATTAGGQVE